MRRRDFLTLAGAAAFIPSVALAQAKVPRVALASPAVPGIHIVIGGDAGWSAFLEQMASHGFVEGRTIIYERYLTPGTTAADNARLIVGSAPDAIFLDGATLTGVEALALTKTIPIVFTVGDPVGQGLVRSLAHPGGNITGIATGGTADISGKSLSLLAEAVPAAKRFAYVLAGSAGEALSNEQPSFDAAAAAAAKLGVSAVPVLVQPGATNDADYVRLFEAIVSSNVQGVQLSSDVTVQFGFPVEAKLALAARLPTIGPSPAFTDAGGLLSYGATLPPLWREAADYLAAILNGTKPADLPVILPTAFDLVVNLTTAKAIGVTIPQSILSQATDVIQ